MSATLYATRRADKRMKLGPSPLLRFLANVLTDHPSNRAASDGRKSGDRVRKANVRRMLMESPSIRSATMTFAAFAARF